jgi:branched-chain amino acid transport system permease protein
MNDILPFIMQGLVLGGIYALVAVGLSLMFGVLDVINVAHGETLALGGYFMFLLVTYLTLPAWPALALSMVGGFGVGALIYWVLIRPAGSRLAGRSPGVVFLVLTLGLSTFMQSGMQAIFGADYRSVAPFTTEVYEVFGVPLAGSRLLIVGVAALLLAALFAFLRYTREGLAIRAVAQNPEVAQSLGIRLGRVFLITFGIGGMMAATAGAMMVNIFKVYPTVGFVFAIKGFAITIIGGLGNPLGALAASLLVGVAESTTVYFLSSEWRDMVAFVVMVVVVLVRPQGLFGLGKEQRSDRV